jgi:hypothetical protein
MARRTRPSRCSCGQPLPTHLLVICDDKFTTVCTCERRWRVVGGRFVADGFEHNPLAAERRAKEKGAEK